MGYLFYSGWKDISLLESSVVRELGNYINGRRLLDILFEYFRRFSNYLYINDQLVTSKH